MKHEEAEEKWKNVGRNIPFGEIKCPKIGRCKVSHSPVFMTTSSSDIFLL